MLERSGRPVHLVGEGIPYHRQSIAEESDIIVTPEGLWRARAGAVAKIGFEIAHNGEFAEIDRLIPIYIRRSEAEEKWESLQSGKPRK